MPHRGVHNRRVRVCEAQSKRWGAQLSQVCALSNLCSAMAQRGSRRCPRARALVRGAFGTRPPALGPFGCVGGDQYHSISRVLGFADISQTASDTPSHYITGEQSSRGVRTIRYRSLMPGAATPACAPSRPHLHFTVLTTVLRSLHSSVP